MLRSASSSRPSGARGRWSDTARTGAQSRSNSASAAWQCGQLLLVGVALVAGAVGDLLDEGVGVPSAGQAARGRHRGTGGGALLGHVQSFISDISVARARASRPRTVASVVFVTVAASR